jgi:hypothetical protein
MDIFEVDFLQEVVGKAMSQKMETVQSSHIEKEVETTQSFFEGKYVVAYIFVHSSS